MNKLFFSALATLITGTATAQTTDSLRVEELGEVVVRGVKAQKDAPFAVANIEKKRLDTFAKTGRELPFLFSQTPGIVAWSDNGLGIGASYMRIRGAGNSRINVTIDGVQLNSPEDETVFWANMSSYASLLGNVQIQRGVGTSTNGDGAFGGNIALTTKNPSLTPSLELTGSYGSFNSYRAGGQFSSGLLLNHLVVEGAYHHTATDGFMNGTSGNAGSYYGGLSWIGNKYVVRYRNIGNYEHMGQAWNGVDTGKLLDGNSGVKSGLNTYADFWNAGMGKYNTLYELLNDSKDPSKGTSRYKMNDGSLWDKTTDNFWQNHNILSLAVDIDEHWKASGTLHYTYGYGYYEEFRYQKELKKFGLSNFTLSDGTILKQTDFVRKKGLEQHAYGLIWNANYRNEDWDVVTGLSAQNFDGTHFGRLTYIANDELRQSLMKNGQYTYYDSKANKGDESVFLKATYKLTPMWNTFVDLQYRYVTYRTDGINDKFIDNGDGTYSNQRLNINEDYHFFNPKAGFAFHNNGHRAYVSAAISNREPERNNFTDNGSYPAPKAERLTDIELGYNYTSQKWAVGVNGYYMMYDNQLVQTGELSDIGEYLTTNIKDSYRMGVELTASYAPLSWLDIYGNAALSQNKIKDFNEVVDDWDVKKQTIHYDNSTLAFSPSTILNGFMSAHWGTLEATWHTNFVSRQYLDNSESKDRSLPAYSQSDISASYTLNMKRWAGIREIIIGANLNNVFDSHYAANGWVYSAIYASGGHTNDNRYRQIGFFPMAGRNFMVNLTVKL